MFTSRASAGTASQTAAAGSSQEKEHSLNENGANPSGEELSGPMLEPSAFNKNWVSMVDLHRIWPANPCSTVQVNRVLF